MKTTQSLLKQFFLASCITLATATANAQIITTYAGTGAEGYTGDGGACISATFKMGWGRMAQDSSGNLYVVDDRNYAVRKITPAGIISTFAGTGIAGFSGDGGPATAASLDVWSGGIALDATGNVYVGCRTRIRKINTSGIISTIAGTGTRAFSGDGGPATAADITSSDDIVFDRSGNLYFSDFYRIRKITPSGTISTVAGNGTFGTSGDGGPATAASQYITCLAIDPAGNLLYVDGMNHRIRKVNTSGIITTISGSSYGFSGDGGPASAATMSSPLSITTDAMGNIYFYDHDNVKIRKINTSGIINSIAGNGLHGRSGDGGPALAASLDSIQSIVIKPSGDMYLYCGWQQKIRKISASSTQIPQVSSTTAPSLLIAPNPSHGRLSVKVSTTLNEPIAVTIINTLGMKLKEYSFEPNVDNELDLQLPAGIYYMSALSSSGKAVTTFVVE